MKALHPSDHEIKATRVPGGTDNTLAMAIDQVFTYIPAGGPLRFVLRPNIVCPLTVEEDVANNGDYAITAQFLSPALCPNASAGFTRVTTPAADILSMAGHMINSIESARITSESVTINMLAPATANQGACVSAQIPNCPQTIWTMPATGAHPMGIGTDAVKLEAMEAYAVYDMLPTKAQLLSGTRAYSGQARDGCYVPLRLSDFKWHRLTNSTLRQRVYANNLHGQTTPINGAVPCAPWNNPTTLTNVDLMQTEVSTMPLNVLVFGDMGETASVTHFDGYDQAAAFEVRVRLTIEARVPAGSQYAPLCQAPPLPDDLALRMYPEIAGRMKNAYPASYNDWDKLKSTIKSIGRSILQFSDPLIHLVTAGLPMGGAISTLATSVTDGLRRKLDADAKEEKALVTAEQAARQRASDQAAAAVRAVIQRQLSNRSRKKNRQRAKPKPLPKPGKDDAIVVNERELMRLLGKVN